MEIIINFSHVKRLGDDFCENADRRRLESGSILYLGAVVAC